MRKINIDRSFSIVIIAIACLLTACAPHQEDVDTTNLQQLQGMTAPTTKNAEAGSLINTLRTKALEEEALSLGAQAGLASASQEIDGNLEKNRQQLETLFNFNGMILTHSVLPPVLVEGDDSVNLADPDTIRIADKNYKILKQARFVTAPPNWRDYLWMPFEKPAVPNKVLLPKTADERKGWSRGIRIGWDKGIEQASSIFQQNLARLKRDYKGMILYRKLLQEKMITPPFVSRTELGVTGDSSNMRINDQVLRITEHPQLQTDSNGWKAIVVKQNDN